MLKLIVKVVPGSKKERIERINENEIKVKIRQHPVEGKANSNFIEFLSKKLGIPKSAVQLLKGYKQKNKLLAIDMEENTMTMRLNKWTKKAAENKSAAN